MPDLKQILAAIDPLDTEAMESARRRQRTLTKPEGSLGHLEDLSIRLAGIFGEPTPEIRRKAIILAAADHGVVAEGVSAYPQEVTSQMVSNFLAGGACINVLSRHVGVEVVVVDAGVAGTPPRDLDLLSVRSAGGTGNMALGPAMSRSEAARMIEEGAAIAGRQLRAGVDILGTGDMGIGNTTAASAITAVLTRAGPEHTTGFGAGVSEEGRSRKIEVVRRALDVNQPDPRDPLGALAGVGGFEIGFLTGVILGGAASSRPVVLDGFASGAAALIADALCPGVRDYLIAAHRSTEPGHRLVLSHLRLRPLLELDMRLGEGTGAALAMPIVEAAARCLAEMASFDDAGVSNRGQA